MKKEILFLLLDEWSDWEASYLSMGINILSKGNYCVKTLGINKESAKSIGNFKVLLDYNLLNIPKDYEALILIGGMNWRLNEYNEIKEIIKDCVKNKKILGAICDAVGFLGTTGILNNINHTGNNLQSIKEFPKSEYNGESHYIYEMAVCDNKIITANGTASLEFAKKILLELEGISPEEVEKWYQFHKLGCYIANIPVF